MPFIVINDDNKEQMRSSMREQMRRNYRGGVMNYRGGSYHSDEAYKEGYEHGYKDGAWDESDEHMRRGRDSMGRYV